MADPSPSLSLECYSLEAIPAEILQYFVYEGGVLGVKDVAALRLTSSTLNSNLGLTAFDRAQQGSVEGVRKAVELKQPRAALLALRRGIGISEVDDFVVLAVVYLASREKDAALSDPSNSAVWIQVFMKMLDMNLIPLTGRAVDVGKRIVSALVARGPVEILDTLYTRGFISIRSLYTAVNSIMLRMMPRTVLAYLFALPWQEAVDSGVLNISGFWGTNFFVRARTLLVETQSPSPDEVEDLLLIFQALLPFIPHDNPRVGWLFQRTVELAIQDEAWFGILRELGSRDSYPGDFPSGQSSYESSVGKVMALAHRDLALDEGDWGLPMRVLDFLLRHPAFRATKGLFAYAVTLENDLALLRLIETVPKETNDIVAVGCVRGANKLIHVIYESRKETSVAGKQRKTAEEELAWVLSSTFSPLLVPHMVYEFSGHPWANDLLTVLVSAPGVTLYLSDHKYPMSALQRAAGRDIPQNVRVLLDSPQTDVVSDGAGAVYIVVQTLMSETQMTGQDFNSNISPPEDWLTRPDFGTSGDDALGLPYGLARAQKILGMLLSKEGLVAQTPTKAPLAYATRMNDLYVVKLLVFSGKIDPAFKDQKPLLNVVKYPSTDDSRRAQVVSFLLQQPGVEVTEEVLRRTGRGDPVATLIRENWDARQVEE